MKIFCKHAEQKHITDYYGDAAMHNRGRSLWECCDCHKMIVHPKLAKHEIQDKINDLLPEEKGELSDGYHSFNELYEFRKVFNAALFNQWAELNKHDVHKSLRHNDGELCFGGGWFIVVAILPTGQISNHYNIKDWDLFEIPEVEKAKYPFDGHTPEDTLERLKNL